MTNSTGLKSPIAWMVGGLLLAAWLAGVLHAYQSHSIGMATAALLLPPYGVYMAAEQSLGHSEADAAEVAAGREYVQRMAAEEGAVVTPSGIVMKTLVVGTGQSPTPDSTVTAHYHGTLRDGTVFDSSVRRGQPFTASLGNVIECWREAMPLMREGGKSLITCPAQLAYGDRGAGRIPPGAALTFETELIEVVE
jgi:FKBP-type peptidyl-prolyl cis-trans isomerase